MNIDSDFGITQEDIDEFLIDTDASTQQTFITTSTIDVTDDFELQISTVTTVIPVQKTKKPMTWTEQAGKKKRKADFHRNTARANELYKKTNKHTLLKIVS